MINMNLGIITHVLLELYIGDEGTVLIMFQACTSFTKGLGFRENLIKLCISPV